MEKNSFTKEQSLAVKGAAILLMMWHHLFLAGRFDNYTISFQPFQEWQVTRFASYAKICVSLFAFVSGYGLYLSYKGKHDQPANQWIKERYVKTFRGYWFVVFFSWLVFGFLNGRPYSVYGFKTSRLYGLWNMAMDLLGVAHIVTQDSKLSMIGTWWYMGAALVFILIFPAIYGSFDKLGAICTLGMIMVLPRVLGTFPGGQHFYSFLPALATGALFAKYDVFKTIDDCFTSIKCGRVLRLCVLIAGGCVSYKVYHLLPTDLWWDVKWGFLPVFSIALVRQICIYIKPVQKLLCFLGTHSANIYLTHNLFRVLLIPGFIYTRGHFLLIILVLLMISLGCSILMEFVKKGIRYNHFIDVYLLQTRKETVCKAE